MAGQEERGGANYFSLRTFLLVRHACGAYGETGTQSEMLNRVTHLFDCIEMGQSYTFSNGQVTFSNKFYNTSAVDVWKSYGANMNISSIWWGTTYAAENQSAIEHESAAMHNPDKPTDIPAVAWWKIGKQAASASEYPGSVNLIDVHNNKYLGSFKYNDSLFEGWNAFHSPSHEQYDKDGNIWTVVALQRSKPGRSNIVELKRVVAYLKPDGERVPVAEYHYSDVNLTKCSDTGGIRYPDSTGRMKNVHSVQITKDYFVIPETSYLQDPCHWVYNNPDIPGWLDEYSYEEGVDARIVIVHMADKKIAGKIPVPPMFITHMLGAYQDDENSLLHFDVLHYTDSTTYTKYSFIDEILKDEPFPVNYTTVLRYTINTADWSLVERKDLITSDIERAFEFSTINTAFQGRPYKYAYMAKNPFKRYGSVAKLNVDTGETLEGQLPDGVFPTEPIFVAAPGATQEDDGVVLMSGLDGRRGKGCIMVFNATNMEVVLHATAPKLTLFGIHSKFYSFDEGCGVEDCTPLAESGSRSTMNSFLSLVLVLPIIAVKL